MALGPSFEGPITLTPHGVRRVPASLPRLPLATMELDSADILVAHALPSRPPPPLPIASPTLALPLLRPTLLALSGYLGIGIGIGVAVGLVGLGLVRLVW
jgi:hypothetical protein